MCTNTQRAFTWTYMNQYINGLYYRPLFQRRQSCLKSGWVVDLGQKISIS